MHNIPLQAFWKYFFLFGFIVLNLIQKPTSEIYLWFCYSGHVGIMSFVLNISLVGGQFLVFSIAKIIWQTKVKYKFCPGLEECQDFFVINQDRIETFIILVQYYYYLKCFVLERDFGNLCRHEIYP